MTERFLAGGGQMGERIRAFPWDTTSLGRPNTWPQSLRLSVRLLLHARHPMFIWWGSDLIQFYNDAYRQTMGPERHPSALGAEGRACWSEIWHLIGPQVDFVMSGQGSTYDDDRLVPITRNGALEDVWWTYSYSPLDVDGGVGGVLVICNDVTEQHLARARLTDENKRLGSLFEQAPSFMAVLCGPDHEFELTNAAYQSLIGGREVIGKTVREILPEVEAQGYLDLLDSVYQSGKAHVGTRSPYRVQETPEGSPKEVFVVFVYQPMIEDGSVRGIFVEGVDVTTHVLAEEHLALLNEELKHRVKNTLALVSAIATQTLKGPGGEHRLQAFRGRLTALAGAHDILTAETTASAPLMDVVESALAPHRTGANPICNPWRQRSAELQAGPVLGVGITRARDKCDEVRCAVQRSWHGRHFMGISTRHLQLFMAGERRAGGSTADQNGVRVEADLAGAYSRL